MQRIYQHVTARTMQRWLMIGQRRAQRRNRGPHCVAEIVRTLQPRARASPQYDTPISVYHRCILERHQTTRRWHSEHVVKSSSRAATPAVLEMRFGEQLHALKCARFRDVSHATRKQQP